MTDGQRAIYVYGIVAASDRTEIESAGVGREHTKPQWRSILRQLADAGRDLAPEAERELERIVLELVEEASARDTPAVGSDIANG